MVRKLCVIARCEKRAVAIQLDCFVARFAVLLAMTDRKRPSTPLSSYLVCANRPALILPLRLSA
jgi:hypothetical protein